MLNTKNFYEEKEETIHLSLPPRRLKKRFSGKGRMGRFAESKTLSRSSLMGSRVSDYKKRIQKLREEIFLT